jgi:hypothetical protein
MNWEADHPYREDCPCYFCDCERGTLDPRNGFKPWKFVAIAAVVGIVYVFLKLPN